mmetsp:Transcript_25637/g.59154  ORF Transcript_25637/g.59154 Transcript_25637/m.59154 type:complete len:97 (-) Transcript_25637:44-334(-)
MMAMVSIYINSTISMHMVWCFRDLKLLQTKCYLSAKKRISGFDIIWLPFIQIHFQPDDTLLHIMPNDGLARKLQTQTAGKDDQKMYTWIRLLFEIQ